MREITYFEALREALREEMLKDETVFVMGEDIKLGYIFGVTRGLAEEFGEERVRDTPISENTLVGVGLGAAITGTKPIVEIMFADLLCLAMDQLVNEVAKLRYITGGQIEKIPLVVRTPLGVWKGYGATHSQSPESWFIHVPGLKVVIASTPYDAKGLLKSAIRDDNPVLFFEHKSLYRITGPVPEEEYLIPLGKADIKREGEDTTIISYGLMLHRTLSAAKKLEEDGINVEVIDPRTLAPLDKQTIINSVKKTGRLLIVEEDCKTGGFGAEIAARVIEEAFDFLDAPIKRVATADVPIPFSPILEETVLPKEEDIIKTVKELIL